MGICQVGFVLVFVIGFFDAEWGANAENDWITNKFRVRKDLVQIPTFVPSSPAFVPSEFPPQFTVQTPVKTDYRGPVQDLLGVQSKELLQGPVPSISWTFPSVQQKPQQPDIPFVLRYPLPANSVAAQCGESLIRVEVLEDFFGTGTLMMPTAFSLGGCAPIGEDPTAKVVIFESELHACGSTTMMTENELVYTFNLIFTPQDASVGAPIARSSGAVVGIQCHYPRLFNVTSNALLPTWLPYGATMVAEELLVFSLRIMTEDWLFERPSNQFFLGDFINLEASVMSYNHIPLRVFVDSCVASSDPSVANALRYSFIENNGCLVDSKLTGSSSKFMARTQMDKLQFQLEAFRFQQDLTGVIYIACVLEVAAATAATSVEQKACSFSSNRWLSADDDHLVCGCCDSTCGEQSEQLNVSPRWDTAFVGPISVKEFAYSPM